MFNDLYLQKLLTGNVEVPVANGTDFEEDNHNIPDTSNECPQTVEIIRSKPVSIFPISKRSERYIHVCKERYIHVCRYIYVFT